LVRRLREVLVARLERVVCLQVVGLVLLSISGVGRAAVAPHAFRIASVAARRVLREARRRRALLVILKLFDGGDGRARLRLRGVYLVGRLEALLHLDDLLA
jgi:hypothetical protein